VFSTDGQQERLAFVSNQGVHATDGFNLETYSDGLDWRGDRDGLGIANTSQGNYVPRALINDRERQELLFYFRNDAIGTGGREWCLHFQYNDLVDGKPRVSGMVTMENSIGGVVASPKSAWAVPRSTGITDVFIGYGVSATAQSATGGGAGQVYRETGTTIPSVSTTMRFNTRRMFLAGMGQEWRLGELYGYAGIFTAGNIASVAYSAANRKTNAPSDNTATKTFTFSGSSPGELLHKVAFNLMCEGAYFIAVVSGEGNYGQEYLIIDGDGFGVEDSGL
jgi:hypothetical protein